MIWAAMVAQFGTNPASGYGGVPHWGWYVILYFFLGGLAAGVYCISTLFALAGDERDRVVVRLGYRVAFPLVLSCAVLLVVDLGVPSRFWHMMIRSNDFPVPMFKAWSPISLGAWGLAAFGGFSFVSFVGTLIEEGRLKAPWLVRLDHWARSRGRSVQMVWGIIGTGAGFFLAGYTGVLVTGTSVALWHNAILLGPLFLASAASTSYALLTLLLLRGGVATSTTTVRKLTRADRSALVMELIIVALALLALGRLAEPIVLGGFGAVFWLGVVGVGLVVPLFAHRLPLAGWSADRRAFAVAGCVLVGGLLLRFVVVMAPQFPQVALWSL